MSAISAQDAIGAYMTAAAHAYSVEIGQVNQPSFYSVDETKNTLTEAKFRINPPQERDNQGRFLPALANCTYIYDAQMWVVDLPNEEPIFVDVDNGEYKVRENDIPDDVRAVF